MKKLLLLTLSCLLALTFTSLASCAPYQANALGETQTEADDTTGDRGLFVTLSISINGSNGQVYTTARHDFSIFSSTVIVYLYLYCSDTYQESYSNMTLVSSEYTGDLDLGVSITAYGSTNNTQKYWQGRMYYKIDNGAWEERVSGTLLFSASGNPIN